MFKNNRANIQKLMKFLFISKFSFLHINLLVNKVKNFLTIKYSLILVTELKEK
jgi:hypothetical protein